MTTRKKMKKKTDSIFKNRNPCDVFAGILWLNPRIMYNDFRGNLEKKYMLMTC